MKNIIIPIAIFIIMLFSITFSVKYLGSICTTLEKKYYTLENYIEHEKWDEAYRYSLNVAMVWKNYSHTMSIFVHHQEIDDINIEMSKMTQHIKSKNKEESLASVETLKFLITHIINLEKVNSENLL